MKTSWSYFLRLIRDLANNKNFSDVEKIIKVLDKDFVSSSNPNAKRGGVIGLAATSIGLGRVMTSLVLFKDFSYVTIL